MLIETLIFNGYKSVCQILGDHILCNRNTIGILCDQLTNLISFKIINKSGKSGRCNIDIFDTGCGVDNTSENTHSHADADDAERKDCEQ